MILKTIYKWDNFFTDYELDLILDKTKTLDYNTNGSSFMGFAAEKTPEDIKGTIIEKFANKFDFLFHPPSDTVENIQMRRAFEDDYSRYESSLHTDGSDIYWDRNLIAAIIPLSDPPEGEESRLDFYESKLFGKHCYTQYNGEEMNKLEWNKYMSIPYVKNQALVFHPSLFHAPYPTHGYGTSNEDARFTINCFFRLGYSERMHKQGFKLEVKEV